MKRSDREGEGVGGVLPEGCRGSSCGATPAVAGPRCYHYLQTLSILHLGCLLEMVRFLTCSSRPP